MPNELCTLRSGVSDDLVTNCDTTDPFSQSLVQRTLAEQSAIEVQEHIILYNIKEWVA